ncbi:MAG TPA: GGDEF domain-containing protein [Gemmatimonadales bacterium]
MTPVTWALLGFAVGAVSGAAVMWWRVRRMVRPWRDEPPAEGGAYLTPGAVSPSTDSLESVAFSVCEAARQATGQKVALVLRSASGKTAEIVSVSHGGDRRLLGSRVSPEAAAGRASLSDVPVVGLTGQELFGHLRSDRRQQDEEGTAFPLHDGRQPVGSLVVFCRPDDLEPDTRERLMEVVAWSGPRLGSAAAVRAAEMRAHTDELTGLWNRRLLETMMQDALGDPCALLLLDLDRFKSLNDNLGHAAGDAALRHVARVLRGGLRGDDLAARVGGEEFALWLPGTPLTRAVEVAERVRSAVADSRFHWAGAELGLTCSIGVAAKPEIVQQTANLYTAADAALYRAKEAGRNRAEVALPMR